MAKLFLFFDKDNNVFPDLSPEPFLGVNAEPDIKQCLLQTFINACADASDYTKPQLEAVHLMTERFSRTEIRIGDALTIIKERPTTFQGLHEARANCPKIFNW